ncbi:MAG: XVIPCD domain-containing protein [Luteibacter jiangsuensis]
MTLSSTDYALLAQDSYQDPVLNKPKILGDATYEAIDVADNPRTGFQATAYRRMDTGEIVIAYRGTEFDREPVHDGGVDAGMVLTGVNAQTQDSVAFTERVLERAKLDADLHHKPLQVTVTGHSLGGTLAEINAAKFGLKGETFNAYGAAGLLQGVPTGGNQVIDHVRAGDLVSAASTHFGEVRIYAAQQDIDTLSKAGYRDDSGILSPRNPIKATDFDAHAIDNFVPDSKLLGQSIINPESQARYRAHEGMIDRYRSDVMDIRKGLSATWEVPKEIGERAHALGCEVAQDMAEAGRAIGHAAHEVADAAKHAGREMAKDVGDAAHAIGDKVSGAWNTLSHPGSWFDGDKPAPRLDDKSHPDHALFQQAREGVHRLDARHERTPDERSDRLAASLTVAARQGGMQRIDDVDLSADTSRTYAMQGDANSPFKQVAEVDTQRAVTTPIEESSRAWQEVVQRAQLVTDRQHTRQQQPGHTIPGPGL